MAEAVVTCHSTVSRNLILHVTVVALSLEQMTPKFEALTVRQQK
jgi:hypothetical protein